MFTMATFNSARLKPESKFGLAVQRKLRCYGIGLITHGRRVRWQPLTLPQGIILYIFSETRRRCIGTFGLSHPGGV